MSTTPAVRLRPTMSSDLDFVISVEQDDANRSFITPWDRTQHEGAIRFPDFRHFIIEAGASYLSRIKGFQKIIFFYDPTARCVD